MCFCSSYILSSKNCILLESGDSFCKWGHVESGLRTDFKVGNRTGLRSGVRLRSRRFTVQCYGYQSPHKDEQNSNVCVLPSSQVLHEFFYLRFPDRSHLITPLKELCPSLMPATWPHCSIFLVIYQCSSSSSTLPKHDLLFGLTPPLGAGAD